MREGSVVRVPCSRAGHTLKGVEGRGAGAGGTQKEEEEGRHHQQEGEGHEGSKHLPQTALEGHEWW